MILVYKILLVIVLLAMLSAIILYGWRASKVTQRNAARRRIFSRAASRTGSDDGVATD